MSEKDLLQTINGKLGGISKADLSFISDPDAYQYQLKIRENLRNDTEVTSLRMHFSAISSELISLLE